ncbi:MAG: bifunctional 2-polyprenyl-6-hydroxyphenol methylase/3-demethylubiquinol 3-O-methyltransferase UbiG [Pseudomonadota bacterium]
MKDDDGVDTDLNVDAREVAQFDALASQWWETDGPLHTLHALNPARVGYVSRRTPTLAGVRGLDVGCGGGILTEALADQGADMLGIDLSADALAAARLHLYESGHQIRYEQVSVEELAARSPGEFQLVTCLELLEHVPDPASTIHACAALASPGGDLFFSTIHRNAKAYALAVVGAEYVLGLLPRGTHDYTRFIRPSELAATARQAGLELLDLTGLSYNPLTRRARLTSDVSVNYLAHLRKHP